MSDVMPYAAQPVPTQPQAAKNPVQAAVISFFIPGLGTLTVGDTTRGVFVLVGFFLGNPLVWTLCFWVAPSWPLRPVPVVSVPSSGCKASATASPSGSVASWTPTSRPRTGTPATG